ncbi:hypothetical protein AB0B71_29270 [Micromonospora echinofusca]|uniref:CorA family divalent cation transporter n=1 Tax=Micromonospora echinofusca TaxID=47858 RepID=UPI0033FB5F29
MSARLPARRRADGWFGGWENMNLAVMPELQWRYGYPAALGLMALAAFTLHRLFRRSGWL